MSDARETEAPGTRGERGPGAQGRTIPTRSVAAWVVYDLANTIFSMGVLSLYYSLYVRRAVGERAADSTYSLITAISMGLIFVVSPLLGAMTDRARRRMPFLFWSTIVCCAATAVLGRGPFLLSALLFIVANAAYQAGVQFYDALLPDVSTPENVGRIGGIGVGVGYLGSYIAVGLGAIPGVKGSPVVFTLIAASFFVIALPCFLLVQERRNPHPRPIFGWSVVRESTAATMRALREGQQYPGLLRFLVGRVFYTDAINTVIAYMTLYTVNAAEATGLTSAAGEAAALRVMAIAITCAIAGGFAWGRVVDAMGPKRTLAHVLRLWLATFGLAAAIGFLHLAIGWLVVVACMAGIALGGTWAADRPYMLRLTPPSRVGEFYGLYGMVGRFSAVTGPVLWGLTTTILTGPLHQSTITGEATAIVTLLGMIVLSMWILRPVTDAPRTWARVYDETR